MPKMATFVASLGLLGLVISTPLHASDADTGADREVENKSSAKQFPHAEFLKHKPNHSIAAGIRYEVRSKIDSVDGINLARVYFKIPASKRYQFVVLNESSNSVYSAKLPAADNSAEALEYKIVVQNAFGKVFTSQKFTVPVIASPGLKLGQANEAGFIDVFSEYPKEAHSPYGFMDNIRYTYGVHQVLNASGNAVIVAESSQGLVASSSSSALGGTSSVGAGGGSVAAGTGTGVGAGAGAGASAGGGSVGVGVGTGVGAGSSGAVAGAGAGATAGSAGLAAGAGATAGSAGLAAGAGVGTGATVGTGAMVGAGTMVGSGTMLGTGTMIGAGAVAAGTAVVASGHRPKRSPDSEDSLSGSLEGAGSGSTDEPVNCSDGWTGTLISDPVSSPEYDDYFYFDAGRNTGTNRVFVSSEGEAQACGDTGLNSISIGGVELLEDNCLSVDEAEALLGSSTGYFESEPNALQEFCIANRN